MRTLDMCESSEIDEDEDFSTESALDWQGIARQRDMGKQLCLPTIAAQVMEEQGRAAMLTFWHDDDRPLRFGR